MANCLKQTYLPGNQMLQLPQVCLLGSIEAWSIIEFCPGDGDNLICLVHKAVNCWNLYLVCR